MFSGWFNLCNKQKSPSVQSFVRRCKLVVLGLEVGGKFSHETVAFLRQLAKARARESLARLRRRMPAVQRVSLHR